MGNSAAGRFTTSEHFQTLAANRAPGFVEAVQRHAQCDAYIAALTTVASAAVESGDVAMSIEDRDALHARVRATQLLFSAGVLETHAKVWGRACCCVRASAPSEGRDGPGWCCWLASRHSRVVIVADTAPPLRAHPPRPFLHAPQDVTTLRLVEELVGSLVPVPQFPSSLERRLAVFKELRTLVEAERRGATQEYFEMQRQVRAAWARGGVP